MNLARASVCLAIAAAAAQNRITPELRVGLQGGEPAYFSVLESVEARHVLQEAEQLMTRGRVAEALDKIRPLATGSANRVVRVRFLPGGVVRPDVEGRTWFGLWELSQRLIAAQPAEVRAEVERIDGSTARARLNAALAAHDEDGVRRVFEQLPWTRAGGEALALLGAFALERGYAEEALATFRRVAARPDFANDPSLIARVAVLAASLRDPEAADDLRIASASSESTEIAGRTTTLRALASATFAPLPPSPPSGGFVAENGRGVADPGDSRNVARWVKQLESRPRGERSAYNPGALPIYPVIAGETVYSCDGWSLAAFDLVTGKPRWNDAAMARGWSEVGNERRQAYVTGARDLMPLSAAVGSGVVVAPLLVPLKLGSDIHFQGISVRAVFPYRKLHAFDARTGAPIWDHWRPAIAQNSQELVDRYRSSSPPVIAGERVIAPICTIADDATVTYHLAAFSLRDGKTLWSTYVVSGPLENNMFGRSLLEFASSPPAVDGDRVYVSTDLGVVACLDLLTGRILWLSRYDTLPLPPSRMANSQERQNYWAANPPALSRDLAFFAPIDSEFLVAFERDNGRFITKISAQAGFSRGKAFRYLLGSDERSVYVYNGEVHALDYPALDAGAFAKRVSSQSVTGPNEEASDLPRPALTSDRVLVPGPYAIHVLSRGDMRQLFTIPYEKTSRERGNLASADGVIVSGASAFVSGFYDADAIVAAARRAVEENPRDAATIEKLAQCLRRRGDVRARRPDGLAGAMQDFQEAEQRLESMPGLEEARALTALALGNAAIRSDPAEAVKAFRRAFEHAREAKTRREAALLLERKLPSTAAAERETVLAALDREFGKEAIETDDWGKIPIALFVRLRRADNAYATNPAAAVAAWQEAILGFRREPLGGGTVESYARTRIADAIRDHGRSCYAAVEAEAKARLAALGPNASPEELGELARLYPNSETAAATASLRLQGLVKNGRSIEVPQATLEVLITDPSPATRREALRADAAALRSLGNDLLADRIDAKAAGNAPPRLPLRELDGPSGAITSEVMALSVPIDSLIQPEVDDGSGGSSLLALAPSALFATRDGAIAWNIALKPDSREEAGAAREALRGPGVSILHGVVAFANGDALIGVHADNGQVVFERTLGGAADDSLAVGGLMLALVRASDGNATRVVAIDAVAGAPLWEARLEEAGAPYAILASTTEVALLPQGNTGSRTASRFDLVTGEPLAPAPLPNGWNADHAQRAALYGSHLVYADFPQNGAYDRKLIALDLAAGGRVAWQLPSEPTTSEEIKAVLLGLDEITLVKRRSSAGSQVLAVAPRSGDTRVLATLSRDMSKIAGVSGWDNAVRWRLPIVVLYSKSEDGSNGTRVDSIELRRDGYWTKTLPVAIAPGPAPAPAVGRDMIALAFTTSTRPTAGRSRYEARLLRRDTGEWAADRAFQLQARPLDAGVAVLPNSFAIAVGPTTEPATLHGFLSKARAR